MVGRIGNKSPIASTRRYFGFTQDDFAEFAEVYKTTYALHELNAEQFRVREFQLIAGRLEPEQRLRFAGAVVETIFGKGYEVTEST